MILILTRDDLTVAASEKPTKDVELVDARSSRVPLRGSPASIAEADAVLFVDKGRARVLKSRHTAVPSAVLELGAAVRLVLPDRSTDSPSKG